MKLKSAAQLVALTGAVSAVPLMLGALIAGNVLVRQQSAYKALDRDIAGIRAGEEIAIDVRDLRRQLEQFAQTGDRAALDEAAALIQDTAVWLDRAESAAHTDQERALIGRVRAGYRQFVVEFHRLSREPESPDLPARVREFNRTPLVEDKLRRPAQEYLDFIETEIEQTNATNQAMAWRMLAALVLLGVCGPLSGLLAGYGISRGVSRSLIRLSVPVQDAAGKLNEVVGPITLSAMRSLDELEGVLQHIAAQVGAAVARLQESQRRALRAEQLAAVGQLAAGMAHELRNPLTSMKILLQAAADSGPPAVLDARDLSIFEDEITRLEKLTQGLLDFARPPRPELRRIVLQSVIRQVVELIARRAALQGVRLDCRLPDAPAEVLADEAQVRQVLLNLLLNALEAIPGAGTVRVELGDGGPLAVRLSILDDGCGLPADRGANIFEPFVSTKETGLGLGLSISKRIIEDHGGTLTAASRPEGGSTFTVRLPAVGEIGEVAAASRDLGRPQD
ncbi:MAG: sensor histidine kinase [Gemmataceae bacterium]